MPVFKLCELYELSKPVPTFLAFFVGSTVRFRSVEVEWQKMADFYEARALETSTGHRSVGSTKL